MVQISSKSRLCAVWLRPGLHEPVIEGGIRPSEALTQHEMDGFPQGNPGADKRGGYENDAGETSSGCPSQPWKLLDSRAQPLSWELLASRRLTCACNTMLKPRKKVHRGEVISFEGKARNVYRAVTVPTFKGQIGAPQEPGKAANASPPEQQSVSESCKPLALAGKC